MSDSAYDSRLLHLVKGPPRAMASKRIAIADLSTDEVEAMLEISRKKVRVCSEVLESRRQEKSSDATLGKFLVARLKEHAASSPQCAKTCIAYGASLTTPDRLFSTDLRTACEGGYRTLMDALCLAKTRCSRSIASRARRI